MVLEDDTDLAEGIELSLQSDELNFVICETIAEARKALEHYSFDLLIFDINLPDGNGLVFCRELKRKIQIPIALLTAKGMEMDIVKGLESGADDYITKPFSLMVLRARIRMLLRRNTATSEQEYVEDNALSVGIRRLRDKLEDDSSNPIYIKTVYEVFVVISSNVSA